MDKYIIHACPKRMWYVERYLVPSMRAQGIDPMVRCDHDGLGNLEFCMRIFEGMDGYGATWHLQDDVITCHDFAERTKQHTEGIVCGFLWEHAEREAKLWKSFQCIRIPDELARGCAEWFYKRGRYLYRQLTETNAFDDCFFEYYLTDRKINPKITKLLPNLVDHIDYLIGGTTVSFGRKYPDCRSAQFEDLDLVEELKERLKE